MSQQSTSICQSILIGKCRYEEYQKAEWLGSADATWDGLLEWFDASQIDQEDARDAPIIECQRHRIRPGWSAYLNQCSPVGFSTAAFKVGITSLGPVRFEQHDNNPLLTWTRCRSVACGSKRTAQFIENYMLAAATHAGMWLGGEWIAGCKKSIKLAVRSSVTRSCASRIRSTVA